MAKVDMRWGRRAAFALALLALANGATQSAALGQDLAGARGKTSGELPEAPSFDPGLSATGQSGRPPKEREAAAEKQAGKFDEMIEPGAVAPKLSVPDKFLLGMRAAVSPVSVTGWLAASSLGYARNAAPMYAQTGEGYAQRLGASAARSASATVMTDSVMASLLREDTRYYKMGVGHSVGERTGYALTRVFVTPTDGGRRAPNLALLIGNVAGASMTQSYYPRANRGVGSVAETYGRSLAFAGVGFYVREFVGKWLAVLHLRTAYT